MATIDEFKAQLIGGGARANQFKVILNTPGPIFTGLLGASTQFFIKTASLPGQTITEIPVNYRGRQLFIAGDRTFETWTTTILNDTDFRIRNGIERWMNAINDLDENTGLTNVGQYTAQLTVQQLDRDDRILKSYTLRNCWPTVVAPIELGYDNESAIEEFEVTWRYTDFSASNV